MCACAHLICLPASFSARGFQRAGRQNPRDFTIKCAPQDGFKPQGGVKTQDLLPPKWNSDSLQALITNRVCRIPTRNWILVGPFHSIKSILFCSSRSYVQVLVTSLPISIFIISSVMDLTPPPFPPKSHKGWI
jgi:hypothetical protein